MTTVTVSPKFQVVIPKIIRQQMEIKAGQQFQLIHYNGRLEFIPLKTIKGMKGFLKDIDTLVPRENDRL